MTGDVRGELGSHADAEARADPVGVIAGEESPAYPILSFSASCEIVPGYKAFKNRVFPQPVKPNARDVGCGLR